LIVSSSVMVTTMEGCNVDAMHISIALADHEVLVVGTILE